MYFSSVLDLCTLNLVSHVFSHHSYCNSQLNCLFACVAFHWPISSKHFSHCGVCTYRTQFVANFAFRSICRTSQLFFPTHPPHFLCMVTTLLHCYSFYMRFPLYILQFVMLNFCSCYTQKSISCLFLLLLVCGGIHVCAHFIPCCAIPEALLTV